jgi:integrase
MEAGVSITIRTAADVGALPITGERYRAWDATVKGLCIRVGASGGKSWWFEYRDLNGKRQCVKLGPVDRVKPGDARKLVKALGVDPAGDRRARKAAEAAAKRDALERSTRTLRALLGPDSAYRAELDSKRSGTGTRKRIEVEFAELLDRQLDEITALDLERIRRRRLKAGTRAATLNRSWNALRAALNGAVRLGIITANPIGAKALPKLSEPGGARVRWLGQRDHIENFRDADGNKLGERARFLAALAKAEPHLRTAVTIAYWTGLRRGEVFGLTWGAVDLDRAMVMVRACTSKGNKSRHLPMPAPLVEFLKGWRPKKVKDADLVVPSPKGGGRLTHINRGWQSLVTAAQLTDFRFHDCRHNYATRLAQAGTPLTVVRELLGHASVAQTEIYSHIAPEQLRDAVGALS